MTHRLDNSVEKHKGFVCEWIKLVLVGRIPCRCGVSYRLPVRNAPDLVRDVQRGDRRNGLLGQRQINEGFRRLLWIGKDRKKSTLEVLFKWFGTGPQAGCRPSSMLQLVDRTAMLPADSPEDPKLTESESSSTPMWPSPGSGRP